MSVTKMNVLSAGNLMNFSIQDPIVGVVIKERVL